MFTREWRRYTKHKLILIDSVQPKVKTNHLFVKANLLNVIEYKKYFNFFSRFL